MSELADSEPSGPKSRRAPAPKLPNRRTKKKEKPEEKKTGGPEWRRYLAWGAMVVLGLGAVAEFRAQMGYRSTIATCNAALERIEGKTPSERKHVTFDELKFKLPPGPVESEGVHDFAKSKVYTWTWQGIRRYKVRVFVNPKDGTVMDIGSEP